MAQTKTTTEREEIYIPKGYLHDEPNLYVGVGGIGYLLPRGTASLVPAEVSYEIKRALKAQERLDKKSEALKNGAR